MKARPSLSVVVPVYNGEATLETLCARIQEACTEAFEGWEILLVDDESKDGSLAVIKRLRQSDRRIKLIALKKNAGQQSATYCGILNASGDLIATIDDDLQHPPELIPAMAAELDRSRAELVFAVPFKRRHPGYRRLGSLGTYFLFNRLLGKKEPVRISSCRLFTRSLRDRLPAAPEGFVYISAELLRQTDRVAWISFGHTERFAGVSNYSPGRLARLFLNLWVQYSENPLLRPFKRKGRLYEIETAELEGGGPWTEY